MECNFENITGERIGVKLRKGLKEETVFYYDLEEKKQFQIEVIQDKILQQSMVEKENVHMKVKI